MATLRPTGKVTLASSAKFFRKENPLGSSTGSEAMQEFEILLEEGDGPKDIARAFLETKRELDDLMLVAEYLRGQLNGAELESRRQKLKVRYAKILDQPSGLAEEEPE